MKIKDFIEKVSANQFILKEISIENGRTFAITECTIDEEFKHICIDFGDGNERYIPIDYLLLTMVEFYGKEYVKELTSKLVSYDLVKDTNLN